MNSKFKFLLLLLFLFIGLLFSGCLKDIKCVIVGGKNCNGSTDGGTDNNNGTNGGNGSQIDDSGMGELQTGFDKPFGVFGVALIPEEARKDLGIQFSRIVIKWNNVELSKGEFDWSVADKKIESLGNIEGVVSIIAASEWAANNCCKIENNKCYCSEREMPKGYCNASKELENGCTPNNLEDYKEFVKQLVSRYRDKVKYWQIENEVYTAPGFYWRGTLNGYIETLKTAYSAIKEIDSEAKIVASGIALHDIDFRKTESDSLSEWEQNILNSTKVDEHDKITFENLKNFLEQANSHFDVLDLHSYYQYNDIPFRTKYLKEKLLKLGKNDFEFIMTETNIDVKLAKNPNISTLASLVNEELLKRYSISFSSGIKKVEFFSALSKAVENRSETGDWGLIGEDGTKYPAYYTFKFMVEKLNGFESMQKLDSGKYVYNFSNGRKIFVLWSDSGNKTIDLEKELEKNTAIITRIVIEQGQTIPKTETVDSTKISIGKTPIFVE